MSSDSSRSDGSSVGDSSFPEPQDDEVEIPDDAVVVQYPSLDPASLLNNPELKYDNDGSDDPVDEKVGSLLVELLDQYRKLAACSFEINMQIAKYRLNQDDLKQKDAFDLLDKFYKDFPNVSPVPGSFVDVEHLKLLNDKLQLHLECHKMLKNFSTVVEKTKQNKATAAAAKAKKADKGGKKK